MQHEHRCSRARGENVSIRDVKIETPDRNMTGGCEWRHDRKRGLRFEKRQLVEFLPPNRKVEFLLPNRKIEFLPRKKMVDFRLLAEALRQVSHVVWGRWKSQHRKMVLSPYVEKPLNSKVIESFVPEQRSRKCFSCFGTPMLYMCVMDIMNVLRTCMNTSISHIHIWLCNKINSGSF